MKDFSKTSVWWALDIKYFGSITYTCILSSYYLPYDDTYKGLSK